MELYIEKAFIEDYYIRIDLNQLTISQKAIISIFKDYGEVDKFMDINYNTPEELESIKLENELMGYLFTIRGPESVSTIKDHFFNHSDCEQTLIFTHKTEQWFNDAEKKGALCFSLENYEKKIQNILESVSVLNIDIDELYGWSHFRVLNSLPLNKITICDNYILVDRTNQRMNDNIVKLLSELLKGKENQKIPVQILSSDFNPLRPKTDDQIVKAVMERHTKLNSLLAPFSLKFRIINSTLKHNFDFHARELVSNFFYVSPGKGFNIMPKVPNSNETIQSGCVFEKRYYDKIKKRIKMYNNYINHLKNIETIRFKSYPN